MNLFYLPEVKKQDKEVILSEEESKHACRVLRMKQGDLLGILNGKGYHFIGEIVDDNVKKCRVTIQSFTFEEPSKHHIHIALSPTKNMDRVEWFVEKATELGIHEISFVLSKNSERKVLKLDRIEKIMISAVKQSQRAYLPKLNPLVSLEDFLAQHPKGAIAHCYAGEKTKLQTHLQKLNYPILIGPEGDFTQKEVDLTLKSAYNPVTLGESRLRTETAALYACMLAKTILE